MKLPGSYRTALISTDHEAVADALDQAADYVRHNGHHKGSLYGAQVGDQRPACFVGAVHLFVQSHSQELAARAAVAQILGTSERQLVCPVALWNDHPGTTAEDVIDAMQRAAKELRNG